MKAMNLTVIKWSLIAFITLAAAVVAFGATHQKSMNAKAKRIKSQSENTVLAGIKTAKTSRPVVAPHDPRNVRASFAMPLDPQSLAEDRAAFAPSEALRKQAQTLYEGGDLAGAEEVCFNALNSPPVIHGQPQYVPFVAPLLGRIYLKGGHYAKAIHWLQEAKQNTIDSDLDLDLAVAYVRLGDYKNASRFYSDQSSLQYLSEGEGVLPQDLPGTDSPKALEASILFARGLNTYSEARDEEALVDLQAANRLVPNNPLIAYHCALILSEKRRFAEATPLYECATMGRGLISEEATRHLIGIRAPSGPIKQLKQ